MMHGQQNVKIRYAISNKCKSGVLSTKCHKYATTSGFRHYKSFPSTCIGSTQYKALCIWWTWNRTLTIKSVSCKRYTTQQQPGDKSESWQLWNVFINAAASRNINTEADSASSNEGKNDSFHEDWIQADTWNDDDFSYYIYVESKFATVSISSIDKLCDDCEGGKSSKAEEEDRCEQETCATLHHTTHCLQNC